MLVFGATSLVGSHFVGEAARGLTLAAAGRQDPRKIGLAVDRFTPVDLAHASALGTLVAESPEPLVVNFAARTDVDGVEAERAAGAASPAYVVNALAPEAMARGARSAGKYLLSVSTDFVFDGTRGPSAEGDLPDPLSPRVSWYGWTKGEGERRIRQEAPDAGVVRISYPFRPPGSAKPDFAQSLLDRYRSGTLPPLYTDQQLTPSWVPDVTRAILRLLDVKGAGTFHVASPSPTTPHEFATELFRRVDGKPPELPTGTLSVRLTDPRSAPRPLRGGLRSERLPSMGVPMTDWRRGLELWSEERARP